MTSQTSALCEQSWLAASTHGNSVEPRADTADIGIRLSDVELTYSMDHGAITASRPAPRYALSVQGLLSLIVHRLAQSSTGATSDRLTKGGEVLGFRHRQCTEMAAPRGGPVSAEEGGAGYSCLTREM